MSWPLVKIGDVVEFIRNGLSIKQSDSKEGLPITRIETIADREINLERCGYAGINRGDSDEYLLNKGDILISHINSEKHLAKCAIFELEGVDLIHGMNLLCLRPTLGKVFPKYLFYCLSDDKFLKQIKKITKKSVNQASFTVPSFKELELPLPPLEEQKRIAAILDKADAIRRKRQQAIKFADDFLRSVFLEMFGDPVTNPKGIDVIPMTECFHITTGKLNSNSANDGGKYPFFTCAKEIFYIDDYAFDQEALLLAGNNASADYDVKHYVGKFNAYQRTYVLTLKDDASSYEFYKFALEYQLQNLKRSSKGSNTKYITMEIMARTLLPSVDERLQDEFVRIYKRVGKIISSNMLALKKLEVGFESLSQKAFSGQL